MNALNLLIAILVLSCTGQNFQQNTGDGHIERMTVPKAISGDSSDRNHLDIVFYNVENLFDTENDPNKDDDDFTPQGRYEWSEGRYEKKLKNLSKVFLSMDHGAGEAAIIGLAEVENKAIVMDLGNMIIPNGYGVVHRESPDRRGIDVALLYRKDLIQKLDEDFIGIEFSEQGYTSRDILYFKGQVGNEVIHVFVNHWPSRRGGQEETEHRRLDAAGALKKRIAMIMATDVNAQFIILGDFNDYPDNKSLTKTLNAKSEDGKKTGELINLAYDLEMKGKGTYPYKGDWGMLDQGIISDNLMGNDGLSICEEGLEIHQRDFLMYYDKKYKEYKPDRTYGGSKYYGGYSDHLPIILHFKTN